MNRGPVVQLINECELGTQDRYESHYSEGTGIRRRSHRAGGRDHRVLPRGLAEANFVSDHANRLGAAAAAGRVRGQRGVVLLLSADDDAEPPPPPPLQRGRRHCRGKEQFAM